MKPVRPPLATHAREYLAQGRTVESERALVQLITDVAGSSVIGVAINSDDYSLNSLNGIATFGDGRRLFFKFHSEDDDTSTIAEYYNAELLRAAGFDVDVPLFASGEPGRQILLYALRPGPRLADVCRAIDANDESWSLESVVTAQSQRDIAVADRLLATLHQATEEEVAAEPIHQLFYHRLCGAGERPGFGGRVAKFYVAREFALGGHNSLILDWRDFSTMHWVVNGVEHDRTIAELFEHAAFSLAPEQLAGATVTAHGDDHNANVWFDQTDETITLTAFDPAFAGAHIPALLADVKATFHNVYAHPFWLYEPDIAEQRFRCSVRRDGNKIIVDDDYALGDLRSAFAASKRQNLWRPLLGRLSELGQLPIDWEETVRLALFCCPTLVRDLRAGGAGGHGPVSSAIGWSRAVAAGSRPVAGSDDFTDLLSGLV